MPWCHGKVPLLGAIAGCHIAGCQWIGCHWIGCHGTVPLVGAIAGCHGKVPLPGAVAGCHVVRCHGKVPLLALGAIAGFLWIGWPLLGAIG